MSLGNAQFGLVSDFKAAFATYHTACNAPPPPTVGEEGNADVAAPNAAGEAALEKLGEDLAKAVHKYTLQAEVNIGGVMTTVPPGQIVTTIGTPMAHAGATVTSTIATHALFGKLQ